MNFSPNKGVAITSIVIACLAFTACSKSSSSNSSPTMVQKWDVTLNAKFENPAPAGRTETGTATLQLFSDNTMKFSIMVNGLASGDNLTAAHIHPGDPLTNGGVVLNFAPSFSAGAASGQVPIRSGLADSLKAGDYYVNVHSTQFPGGLLRGQLNDPVSFAADVAMSGANEVPAVNTTATGQASFRLTQGKKLYSKVSASGIESNDTFTVAHIHTAAAGANGPVIIPLCSSLADFGLVKTIPVADSNITKLTSVPIYANAHSKLHPGGIIRGQIR